MLGGLKGPLTVPFTADQGALVAVAGPAPVGVSAAEARRTVDSLVAQQLSLFHVAQTPLAAQISLRAGIGVPPIHAAAWIVPLALNSKVVINCPVIPAPVPALPATASDLHVALVIGPSPDQVFVYEGAGIGICDEVQRTPVVERSTEL